MLLRRAGFAGLGLAGRRRRRLGLAGRAVVALAGRDCRREGFGVGAAGRAGLGRRRRFGWIAAYVAAIVLEVIGDEEEDLEL